jgi:hypothetical protein
MAAKVEVFDIDGDRWKVLSVQSGAVLLLRHRILPDPRPFDFTPWRVWADSDIRHWLNSVFAHTLPDSVKGHVMRVNTFDTLRPETAPVPAYAGDRVFLLSQSETARYLPTAERRVARCDGAGENGWWWLRSPGFEGRAQAVDAEGGFSFPGVHILTRMGVRPAMWVAATVLE